MTAIIAAYSANRVIGKNNTVPWRIREDMKYFKKVTDGSTILMGRNTYQSILDDFGKSLPNRRNIVVSGSLKAVEKGFELARSLGQALKMSDANNPSEEVFIVGGAVLYKTALDDDVVDQMYITEVHAEVDGDVFFPEFDKGDWVEVSRRELTKDDNNAYDYAFTVLIRSAKA